MRANAAKRKDSAAVALGRTDGKKGGPARAAKLTAEQRSDSARKAVQARWAKVRIGASATTPTSDKAVLTLLKQLKETDDPNAIRRLSNQLERAIFHKQYATS